MCMNDLDVSTYSMEFLYDAPYNNALKFTLPVLGHSFEEAKHIPQPKIRAI